MATPEIAPPQTATARRALRWLALSLLLLLLLAATVGGWL